MTFSIIARDAETGADLHPEPVAELRRIFGLLRERWQQVVEEERRRAAGEA